MNASIVQWFFFLIKLLLVGAITEEGKEIQRTRGEGYGSEWIYFPDEDGSLHYVNLTEPLDLEQSFLARMDLELDFKLYSKSRQHVIDLDDFAAPLEKSMNSVMNDILSGVPIKIITHGWLSSAEKSAVMNIANAYLAKNEVNVITVDWSRYSMNMMYTQVASQTREIGSKVARFINSLQKRYNNIIGDQIHLIGHSLGAHVMGVAGFESLVSIGRITGLDPALPSFGDIQLEKRRLDFMDASFVDVIHTCGGLLGFWDAIGTADFYPNNGTPPQPGCNYFKNIFTMDACSHGRSHEYFAESITSPKAFPAYSCNALTSDLNNTCRQFGYMGEGANLKAKGIFYSFTNSKEPFGRG